MKYIINIIFILLLISNFLYAEEIRNKTTIITTDGGIKVYQNEKYYDLLDNVKIDSKDFDLTANNVLAYYDADLYDLTKIIAKKDAEIITSEGAIIKGDEVTYEIKSGKFSIYGNGIFVSENLRVEAEKIEGEIIEINKEKYVKKVDAKDSKKVFIENKEMKSYSKSAIYTKNNETLELFDEVKIIKGQEITTGDYANINMETNDYTIKSINNKVQLLINSED
tara:strand:+ start:114 stop:782 length:669 start_codon:yes stop_codon:yes gene_type:complete